MSATVSINQMPLLFASVIIIMLLDSPYLLSTSTRFENIVKSAGSVGFTKRYYSVIAVYIAIAIGILILVIPNSPTWKDATKLGAVYGFTSYAIFDFTIHFMFSAYDLQTAVMDTIWGTILCAVASSIIWNMKN